MSSDIMTKAKWKNIKRRQKKNEQKLKEAVTQGKEERLANPPKENTTDDQFDIIEVAIVKKKLAEAKEKGDLELQVKLREDLWVLQDIAAGHDPSVNHKNVEETFERLSKAIENEAPTFQNDARRSHTDSASTSSKQSQDEALPYWKEMRKLKKKLREIERLKAMHENGEQLEISQREKIDREHIVIKEIEQIEELMKLAKDNFMVS